MELQDTAVDYRITELRELAQSLRWERRSGGVPLQRVRIALGRRFLTVGAALLDGAGARLMTPSR